MLCQVLKFKERKLLEREDWNFGMEAAPLEIVVGWADQATGGAKGNGSDVGLWWLRLGCMMVAYGGIVLG